MRPVQLLKGLPVSTDPTVIRYDTYDDIDNTLTPLLN
jgi:hypothetical protein